MCLHVQGLGESYQADPWNLANLPRLGGRHGNLLRHVGDHVPGLTAPQLQLGSMFSCRPWHTSPHLLYSLSYLHVGEPKKWCDLAAAWLSSGGAHSAVELYIYLPLRIFVLVS